MGIVIGSQLGWQMTFVLIATLSALALVGVLALFPTVANPPAITLSTRLALLRKPTVFVTLLVTLACIVGNFTVYTYLGPLLQQVTHLNGVGISSVFFLFGLVGLLGNAIGAYSIDRWGAVRTIVPCVVVVGLAFLTLSLAATSFLLVAVAIAMWSIAGTTILPAQQHRLIALSPDGPGVVLSLNSSAIYLGSAGGGCSGWADAAFHATDHAQLDRERLGIDGPRRVVLERLADKQSGAAKRSAGACDGKVR